MADIDLSIDVNDQQLFDALNKAEKELKQLDATADKTGKSIDASFDKAEKSVNEFTSDVKRAEKAVSSLGKEGANIDKGFLKSLRGIRGEMRLFNTLPTVFGAITGGLAKVQQGIEAYNQATNSTAVITKKLEAATEGVVSAYVQERNELSSLTEVVADEKAGKDARLGAIEKLQAQFPGYFENLTLENAKTGELARSTEAAKNGIEELAKAKLRDQLLTELRTEAVLKELEAQRAQALTDTNTAQGLAATYGSFATFLSTQISATVAQTSATTAEAAATDIAMLNKAIDAVFAVTNDVIDQTQSTSNSGLKSIELTSEAAANAAKKQKDENKALAGSIADIEAQLSKVNDQINRQTKARDVDALTPLVEKAKELQKQLDEANKQLEALRNPPQAQIEIPEIASLDIATISLEEKLQQQAELSQALLEQRQAAELELLKSAAFTEEQLTELQKAQELERQKLALETEQKRLEFALQYGALRTEAETQTLQAQLEAVKSQLAVFGKEATEAVQGGAEKKGFSVFRALGIDPDTEEGKAAIAAVEKGVQAAIDNLGKLFDAQVALAEKEVAFRDGNIDRLQQQLENELKLNEQGFASNVKLTQEKLEEENKAREKALQDQKKARTAQLALETITQAANLVTSASQIFNSFAALPFGIGIPIAATVIAAMLGSFIAFKVKAFQATKFNEGGRLPQIGYGGVSDESNGAGHRIEGTDIVVGGGEHVINAQESARHDKLLANINAGKYKGLDLLEIVEGRNNRTRSNNAASFAIRSSSNAAIERQTAIMERYLKHITKRPQYVPHPNGSITEITTDLAGNRIISHIKKPKQ